jgi:uncharacterized membrane protein YhaH (DUF805 family)
MRLSRSSFWILMILWVGAMGLSGLALTAEPTGDGFTRGLNRIMTFLSWQLGGAIIALGLWIAVQPVPKGDLYRWIGRGPGWWALLLLAVFVGFIAYGVIGSQMGN